MRKKSISECILDCFEGSRNSETFNSFSDDEYIGYISAMTVVNCCNQYIGTVYDVIASARDMMKMGMLK